MSSFKVRLPVRLTPASYIFAGGLFIQLIVLFRVADSPLLLPRHGDMAFYNEWARHILAGKSVEHFAFYGLPGYAYWLSAIFFLFGYNPFLPLFIQACANAGTGALVYKISTRLFPKSEANPGSVSTTGVLAAAGWASFEPAQAYGAILMPTALSVFAFWLVVWQIVARDRLPRYIFFVLLGCFIGISATMVATILFLLPLVIAASCWKWRATANRQRVWTTRLLCAVCLLVGVGAGTAPSWTYNCFVARDRVFLSAHSGINLWIGNNPEANGYPRFPPGLRAGQAAMLQDSIDIAEAAAGHPLKRGEVSDFWSAKAWNYITKNFTDWLCQLGQKVKNFWNAFQYDDLSVVTGLHEENVTLLGVYFGVVAALALPGFLLAWRIAPRSRWIAAAILLHLLALLPVFITERYRLAVVPGLLIFASFGVCSFARNLSARDLRPVTIYAGLLIPSALFVSWPHHDPTLWALDSYNAGRQALDTGNLQLAERKLNIALAYVPNNAETRFALGNLNLARRNETRAVQFYLEALALDPCHRGALNNLGVMALEADRPEVAECHFRQALEVENRNPKTHFLLAKSLLAQGKSNDALAEVRCALELSPSQPEFLSLERGLLTDTPFSAPSDFSESDESLPVWQFEPRRPHWISINAKHAPDGR